MYLLCYKYIIIYYNIFAVYLLKNDEKQKKKLF